MNFNTIDLHKELQELKKKSKPELLDEVNFILKDDKDAEESIYQRLKGNNKTSIDLNDLESENIYDLNQIRSLCIKYRLRFLDSKVFKGELPYEAILKIKRLEKKLGIPLEGFKVIAPKQLFKLEDKDSDPLLFLQLSNDKFYFIHKWGGELNQFRSLLAWPMKKFMNMFLTLLVVAFLFTLTIPTDSNELFAFLFVHSFIAICGLACLLIFTLRENFSEAEWDSKYLS